MAKIHFTEKYSTILNILSSQSLKLHYCKEDFCLGSTKISRAAHPMVCFSAYDFLKINRQTISYGKYGIAFKESWILKNKIHPVLYINSTSMVANALADLLRARRAKETNLLPKNVQQSIMILKCFTKNEKGYNSFNQIENFNFKKENEWRFVPSKSFIEGNLISQNRITYLKNPNFYNKKIEKFPLKFRMEDVEKIFVENKKQIKEISEKYKIHVSKISISKWKYNQSEIL